MRVDLQALKNDRAWLPRLAELLDGWKDAGSTVDALVDAVDRVLLKMEQMEAKHVTTLKFFKTRAVLDPRNLARMNNTWDAVADTLRLPDNLKEQWEEYRLKSDPASVSGNLIDWWAAQPTALASAAIALLQVPMTSAAVERSFSLAGVLDTKQRNKTRHLLRKAEMLLYYNGDVEHRFS